MNRIKTAALKPVAFAIFAKETLAEMKHEREIEASRQKIGTYVSQPCPVQIWA